jgi:hypothetical protein
MAEVTLGEFRRLTKDLSDNSTFYLEIMGCDGIANTIEIINPRSITPTICLGDNDEDPEDE